MIKNDIFIDFRGSKIEIYNSVKKCKIIKSVILNFGIMIRNTQKQVQASKDQTIIQNNSIICNRDPKIDFSKIKILYKK